MEQKRYYEPSEALDIILGASCRQIDAAMLLDVKQQYISKYVTTGKITGSVIKALRREGWIRPKPTRTRIAFDVSPELRDAINAECQRRGMTRGQWLEWAERVSQWQKVDRWTPANPLIVTVGNPPDTASD